MKNISQRMISLIKQHPILCALVFLELALIIYYNLFEHECFLGYDASVFYLQIVETWRQKTLFLDNWYYTTGLGIAGQLIPATLLYGILDNVFLAMGLSNLIFIIFYIVILIYIMRALHASTRSILLMFCLLFAPYMSMMDNANCLNYFFMMYFNFAPYLATMMTILYFLLVHYRVHNQQYDGYTIAHVCLCYGWLFLNAISSGVFIMMFAIIPILVYYTVYSIATNLWCRERFVTGMFLLGSAAVSLLGKYIVGNVIEIVGYSGADSNAVWVSLEQFWSNLLSIFAGYLSLTGALPYYAGTPILNKIGISFGFWSALSIGILVTSILCVIKFSKQLSIPSKINKMGLSMVSVLIVNIFMFILCYTTYGAPIFESRYLILIFIIMCIFASIWIDEAVMQKSNQTAKVFVMGGIVVCLIANNVYSYYNIELSRNDNTNANIIASYADQLDVPVVYMPYDTVYSRNMRVLDLDHVYRVMNNMTDPHLWGDYTYYEDAGEYQGPTMMVCTQEFYDALEPFYKNQYKLVTTIEGSTAAIYYSESNPVDMKTGIVHDYNIDYFYSNGISRQENGAFNDDGGFEIKGTGDYATWGPYVSVQQGTYEFILHYDIENVPVGVDSIGQFDVAVDTSTVSMVKLSAEEKTATVRVTFDETQVGRQLEYRVWIAPEIEVVLDFVEIERIVE